MKNKYSLVFLSLVCTINVTIADKYVPAEQILLNCGESVDKTDSDSRKWTPDVGSKFLTSGGQSTTSPAATQNPAVPEVPYMTARVFGSEFTYSFPVASGRKLVRLYFYSNSYNKLNASSAVFSVSTGSYTLLKNFSIAQTTDALNYYPFIVKEYSINVDGQSSLNITFTPSSNIANAYAFVNGIEVMSTPDIYSNTGGTLMIVGQSSMFTIDNTTALENVYRVNVGGNDISPVYDDTGLYRSWYDDMVYIYGASFGVRVTGTLDTNVWIKYPSIMASYVAPQNVYATARTMGPDPRINQKYNLTWLFSVDSGFNYLVRLHFCEPFANINKVNQRVFQIFLNNETAEDQADVFGWTRANGVAVYKDYVVIVPPGGSPQQDLWLAMHPNTRSKPMYYDAILNGVEIFKTSDANGNLAGSNPVPAPKQDVIDLSLALPSSRSGHSKNQKAIIAGGVGGGIVLAFVIGFCVLAAASRRRRQGKEHSATDGPSGWLPLSLYGNSHSAGSAKTNSTGSYASSLPSNLCRHFSFADIKAAATKNFDESLLLGVDNRFPLERI